MASSGVLELTESNFDKTIQQSTHPVLVDFWGEGCQPCKRMAPLIEEIAAEYEGKLAVAKVDVHNNYDVAVRFGVSAMPTFLFFKNGKVEDRLLGAKPKTVLVESIERLI